MITAELIYKAIKSLNKDAEFSFEETNLDTIQWLNNNITIPTKSEILNKIEEIKANELLEKSNKIIAKNVLLARLGITEDEAKLLLS